MIITTTKFQVVCLECGSQDVELTCQSYLDDEYELMCTCCNSYDAIFNQGS